MIYSIDLRERVIAAIDNKKHINDVVATFNVSRRVVYNWLNLRKKTGGLAPMLDNIKGRIPKVQDWDQFKQFAANHKEASGSIMVAEWHKLTGVKMSESAMYRSLDKINYTSKKKLLVTQKQIKQNAKNF